jgi:hypothetical protein
MRHDAMSRCLLPLAIGLAASVLLPTPADAQWRRGFGYELTGEVRIQVAPRDAEVFVDGYLAGVVDDFDGFFQRLRLPVGGHQIVIFLDGYRTIARDLYIQPGSSHRIRLTMDRVGPGEVAEPPPSPDEVVLPVDPAMAPAAGVPAPASDPMPAREYFGAIALRLTPEDATIRVDGEPAEITRRDGLVVVRLAAGEHRIEITREGYRPYTETVLIQRGRTLTIPVALVRGGWPHF